MPRPQKIAILHYACQPVVGGVESIMSTHARLLEEEGHEPFIIAGRGDPKSGHHQGVIIPEIDSRHADILAVQRALLAGEGWAAAAFEGWVERISDLLVRALDDADTCIVHNALTLHKNLALTVALARLAKQERGARHWIAWCHDLAWNNPLYKDELLPEWPWSALKTPLPNVTYVAISEQRRDEAARLFGIPLTEVKLVPNGIDPEAFIPTSDRMRALREQLSWDKRDWALLAPVRITRRKNLELALEITAAIRDHGHDPLLVITGPPGPHNVRSGEYLDFLVHKCHALGVREHVAFLAIEGDLGHPLEVSDSLISELYWWADALLITSVQEGFGLPLLEAGLAHLPMFCTNIPVLREVGSENAHYFEPDDPGKIAEMMLHVLEKPGIVAMRRKVLSTYTWDSIFRLKMLPLLEGDAGTVAGEPTLHDSGAPCPGTT